MLFIFKKPIIERNLPFVNSNVYYLFIVKILNVNSSELKGRLVFPVNTVKVQS